MNPSWWGSLSPVEHVYWVIAIAASTVLAIQLIIACASGFEFHMGSMGSDLGSHGGDAGSHHGDMGMPHFQLMTIRNVVAFFSLFGWTGLAFNHMGLPIWLTIFLSFICGFIMMVITAAIFYGLYKLQSDGNVNYDSAKGLKGTAYLRIPPVGQGSGQIRVVLQGKIIEMEAVSTDPQEIPTGANVLIKEVSNSKAIVERA
jgi:membrane protein implicated in regulation of membrane protease activity